MGKKHTTVQRSDVKSNHAGNTRVLKRADSKPYIFFDRHKNWRPYLAVTRNGNHELLPVSRRVAEELLSTGFSPGNSGS